MPKDQRGLRPREHQPAPWWITRAQHDVHRPHTRRVSFLVVASVLGLALGVGLGPMVGALVDASQSAPPTEPGALLATAATRLREFQYRVGEVRVRDLLDTVTTLFRS